MTDPTNPVPAQLAAGVRQILLVIGGIAIGKGWLAADTVDAIVAVALILLPLVYGQWRTRQAAQARSGSTPSVNSSATPSSTPGDVQ